MGKCGLKHDEKKIRANMVAYKSFQDKGLPIPNLVRPFLVRGFGPVLIWDIILR